MKKIINILSTVIIISCLAIMPARAQSISTSAKQAIVIDFETGQILFEKNAHDKMPTSSMSKAMTIYQVFDTIKKGKLSLDDTLTVSEKAWRKGGSKMFVEVGKQVKVEDLIRGVLVQSGNDATIVLAEGIEGSEDAFADTITDTAHNIGMKDSNFANASGWPDPDHYSTAYDLSVMAKALITNFPEYYHYFGEKEFTYSNIKQRNRNPLIYRNIGADGLKTGHTEDGGYGLIGSGIYNDRRVIIVINGLESEKARAQESAKLLEWGLRKFEYETVITDNQTLADIPVVFGQSKSIIATLGTPLRLAVPKRQKEDIKISAHYREPLIAPITKGQQIGTLHIEMPGQQEIIRPIHAQQEIVEKGWFGKTLEKIPYIIGIKG